MEVWQDRKDFSFRRLWLAQVLYPTYAKLAVGLGLVALVVKWAVQVF